MKLRHILFQVKVRGESLWPELISGRLYWASNLFAPRIGDYAVFRNPADERAYIVKKIYGREGSGYILGGTVPWSSSYCISENSIIGKIILIKIQCLQSSLEIKENS